MEISWVRLMTSTFDIHFYFQVALVGNREKVICKWCSTTAPTANVAHGIVVCSIRYCLAWSSPLCHNISPGSHYHWQVQHLQLLGSPRLLCRNRINRMSLSTATTQIAHLSFNRVENLKWLLRTPLPWVQRERDDGPRFEFGTSTTTEEDPLQ